MKSFVYADIRLIYRRRELGLCFIARFRYREKLAGWCKLEWTGLAERGKCVEGASVSKEKGEITRWALGACLGTAYITIRSGTGVPRDVVVMVYWSR